MNNIESLFNFINLYLKNEKTNKKVILNIINEDEVIEFRIWFNTYTDGYSTMKIDKDIISDDDIAYLLGLYRTDYNYQEEKYYYDKKSKICNYYICLSNKRLLYITNFNLDDVNKYRKMLLNINDDSFIVTVDKRRWKRSKKLKTQEAGYTNYIGIISIVLIMLSFVILGYILYTSLY